MTGYLGLEAYDTVGVVELARRTGAPGVHAYESVGSTMDVAHDLARSGAKHGSVVVAEAQRAGRGRERREWRSPAGGVWFSVVLRDMQSRQLSILPLRVGIALAAALEPLAGERIGVKWPNDLILRDRKLAGILAEARWRGDTLDWVVLGVGINRTASEGVGAAGLGEKTSRAEVLARAVSAVLATARDTGELSAAELDAFAARDIARGRVVSEPKEGAAAGIDASGALLVETPGGMAAVHSGSLVFRS
jgi:BirA family transcriptional regulator, biotin operon repressor / biotin---[acetyl-CoA-carboxylase] ligase